MNLLLEVYVLSRKLPHLRIIVDCPAFFLVTATLFLSPTDESREEYFEIMHKLQGVN